MHARMWPLVAGAALGLSLSASRAEAQDSLRVASPDGKNTVTVHVRDGGLYYAVSRNGQPVPFDAEKVSQSLDAPEVKVDLSCGRLGKAEATCWTCDLSKEYVTINGDYHT